MIDFGPRRFAVWREIKAEAATEIANIPEVVYLERGPVDEVFKDNILHFVQSYFRHY